MKRMMYAAVAACAIGFAAAGIAIACEQNQASNEQGAGKAKLAMLGNGIAAPPSGVVRGDDDDKSSDDKGGKSDDGK